MSIFDIKLPEYVNKIDWLNIVSWVIAIVILVSGSMIIVHRLETMASQLTVRKETVCPSYLSIARSPRDTLLIMRNEPLCNEYVLEHLK